MANGGQAGAFYGTKQAIRQRAGRVKRGEERAAFLVLLLGKKGTKERDFLIQIKTKDE